jgi:hypothetical protein
MYKNCQNFTGSVFILLLLLCNFNLLTRQENKVFSAAFGCGKEKTAHVYCRRIEIIMMVKEVKVKGVYEEETAIS